MKYRAQIDMSETLKFLYMVALISKWEILKVDKTTVGEYSFLVGIREYPETYKWMILNG